MERLTDDRTAQALQENIEKLKAAGVAIDPSNERYVRLAELERMNSEVVRCKDCAFVDSLECPINYIDHLRMIFTNRAPDWFCAEGRRKDEQ